MIDQKRLDAAAEKLFSLLKQKNATIVFAESCTAGLVAATLGRIPGVSHVLAGSFVVYQNTSKENWLGVSKKILIDPGEVSYEVAESMSENALRRTSEADFAVSITGHLGPNAPEELDGVVYLGFAIRETQNSESLVVSSHKIQLNCQENSSSSSALRIDRQHQTTKIAIEFATTIICEDEDRDI